MNNQIRTHLLNAKRAANRVKDAKLFKAIDSLLQGSKSIKKASISKDQHKQVYVHSSLRDGNAPKKNDGTTNAADNDKPDLTKMKVAELKALAIEAGLPEAEVSELKKADLLELLSE